MVFTVTVDSTVHTTESDKDIRYAIVGRVVAEGGDAQSGGRARRVLGWCASREEAEVSLQTLFSQGLFADLEIVPATPR
ncbi:hypothetical protein EHM92_06675 [bacterium]|nr:MAG: hypothetical protein EHM92_06675 [bacterium]